MKPLAPRRSVRVEMPGFSPDPCAVYEALRPWKPFALLESASRSSETGRKSLLGLGVLPLWHAKNPSGNALERMQSVLNAWQSLWKGARRTEYGCLFTVFAYEWKNVLEETGRKTKDDLGFPDALLLDCRDLMVWDHGRNSLALYASYEGGRAGAKEAAERRAEAMRKALTGLLGGRTAGFSAEGMREPAHFPHGWKANLNRGEFLSKVKEIKKFIAAGDIYQANFSQRFRKASNADGFALYRVLRDLNPSPFGGYLRFGDWELISCSPERLVCKQGDRITTRPIAGTRPRGKNAAADNSRRKQLLLSPKERAEHVMLIDLERNDLGRVCRAGTVEVNETMAVEKYSHVQHIVSNITGRLRPDADFAGIVRAVFPGGTITGVPKIRCMEILDALEPTVRGPYTGSFGYMDSRGDFDLNIMIRTALKKDGVVTLQTGAGIVADSMPAAEYQETLDKAKAMALAVELSSAKIPGFIKREFAQAWRR